MADSASLGPAEPEAERTLSHIATLAEEIGPRVSGTAGEDQAVAYIAGQFESFGYTVELFEFEISGFGSGHVETPDDGISHAATLLGGSSMEQASGPAVFVGLGDAEGIAGRDLAGAVAIAIRGGLRFSEKYENAAAAGAVALVVVNNDSGLFSGTIGAVATIPVVGVAGELQEHFRELADSSRTVLVRGDSNTGSVDVIARPSDGATCDIVVGGHHDTVPGVDGATDNASGAALTIELARAMAADGIDEGVCFLTFGGEESGLFGSAAIVDRWTNEDSLPEFMLNLDVVGSGTDVMLIGDDELKGVAEQIAENIGVDAIRSSLPFGTSSDHASFQFAGVRVMFLSSDDFSDIHTPDDTLERIDRGVLEDLGDLAYELIRDLEARVAQP